MPDILDQSEMFPTYFEPKTQNRFRMLIEGISAFNIKALSRPTYETDANTIHNINKEYYTKGGKNRWMPFDITLYDPIVPSAAQQVMEWIRLGHESITGRDGYSDFYKKDLTIHLVGPIGDIIEEWILKGAFVTNYQGGPLDQSVGEIIESTITVQIDYAILNF